MNRVREIESISYPIAQKTKVSLVPSVKLSPTPTIRVQVTISQNEKYAKSNSNQKYGETIKFDDKTSLGRFASDANMSTSSELQEAMNTFRKSHGLPTLNPHPTLCRIAQVRANQLVKHGSLDYHAGFSDLAHSQPDFDSMAEVIFGGVNKVSGIHIVEWGWAQSLTGHKETISDPIYHDGCASVAGLFAVFVFGSN